ncbi:prolipoprotein diacylglyceryl transferase [Candidatus Daviesbacteria bacterium]|nr:prolipoprotein diacylglyceryl transferase [Candidatus Daviesbacteria bacterium]
MFPVLFNLGPVAISSFGFFMAAAFLVAVFAIWRVTQVYGIDEEKTLDLILLTFFGGVIGARIYFVLLNLSYFNDISKVLLINRYPGLSFWGALLGGILALGYFSARLRLNFWQMADFGAIGLLIGIVIGNIGCFLGGCEFGVVSNLPFATGVAGLIGKRFPVSILESLILLVVFYYLWKQVLRFHFAGKIAALFLVLLGLTKFITEFYRGDAKQILAWVSYGHILSAVLVVLGLVVFYNQSKRDFRSDLVAMVITPFDRRRRDLLLSKIRRSWYNFSINLKIKMGRLSRALTTSPRKLKRKLNVKSTPTDFS